jgi:transcriptional regulator with XRE-family HTH domain
MDDFKSIEKHNLKVLGVIVRVNRMKLGYSLRDLAQLTNISHTLISNFEKGQLTPHNDTIKDIFRVLKLSFYDDPKISIKFNKLYKKAFKHIVFFIAIRILFTNNSGGILFY